MKTEKRNAEPKASCFPQNKDDEIAMLRGLVRQQEDATRLLGEKMRNEAQEHVSKR